MSSCLVCGCSTAVADRRKLESESSKRARLAWEQNLDIFIQAKGVMTLDKGELLKDGFVCRKCFTLLLSYQDKKEAIQLTMEGTFLHTEESALLLTSRRKRPRELHASNDQPRLKVPRTSYSSPTTPEVQVN